MKAASKGTYISAKSMGAWQKERKKIQDRRQKTEAVLPAEEKKEEEAKDDEKKEMPVIAEKIELAREDSDELSDNAYEARNRSAQEINSDELDGGLDCSDDESGVAQRKFVQANKAAWKQAPAR